MFISIGTDLAGLLEKLRGYDCITFDIFDTLIKRNVAYPGEVFRLVEQAYNRANDRLIRDFYEKRGAAEREARAKSKFQEITLDEIYERVPYDQETRNSLKQLEIELEKQVCVPNLALLPIFQKLVEEGKHVYIISDMYLSLDIVEGILNECGIRGYNKLYLSSEYRCTKRTGLFSVFLREQGIKKQRIIHIGDGLRSDLLSSIRQRGVHYHAVLIPRSPNKIPYRIGRDRSSLSSDILNSFISNHLDQEKDYFYRMGYAVYGPLLYGFIDWVINSIKGNGVQKVLFLARDSYVIQKAFHLLYKGECSDHYFYLSRRSIFGTRLQGDYSLENVLEKIHMRVGTPVEALLRHMDAYSPENLSLAESMGISLSLPVYRDKPNDRIRDFFRIVNEKQQERYREKATLFREYLSQFVCAGDSVAVVDVGWNGTAQKAIEIAQNELEFGAHVEGYYLGINSAKNGREKDIIAKGYLVDEGTAEEKRLQMKAYMGFLEFFLSAPHGMTTGYVKKDESVFPMLQDYEYVSPEGSPMKEVHILKELHGGALQFISEFSESGMADFVGWDTAEIAAPVFRLCIDAKKEDLIAFGDVRFFDTDLCPMAKPGALPHYFAHPRELKQDFAKSTWKPGFIKRLLGGMPFPYYSIYKLLIKSFNK